MNFWEIEQQREGNRGRPHSINLEGEIPITVFYPDYGIQKDQSYFLCADPALAQMLRDMYIYTCSYCGERFDHVHDTPDGPICEKCYPEYDRDLQMLDDPVPDEDSFLYPED